MEAVSIDLGDEAARGPVEVDRESGDDDADRRLGEVGLADQGEESPLELRASLGGRAAVLGDNGLERLDAAAPRLRAHTASICARSRRPRRSAASKTQPSWLRCATSA
jgi:hypothetical protein